jgi:hypothetical protein
MYTYIFLLREGGGEDILYIRELQCVKLDGNRTENDIYWLKISFHFLQNDGKCMFMRICIQSCKQCYYDQETKNLKITSMGIQNTQFLLISNSLMAALKYGLDKGSGTTNYAISFKYFCF